MYQLYLKHYSGQCGGGFPAYRGTTFQHGERLGDILKADWRFIAPIASSASASFVKDTSTALSNGKSLKDSAKQAILPAARSGIDRTIERITTGKGRRRAKKRKSDRKKGTSNQYKRRRMIRNEEADGPFFTHSNF